MAASGSLSGPYRVDVEFDPPGKQSRLTVLFRGFMLIPHIIIMAVLGFNLLGDGLRDAFDPKLKN